MASCIYTLDFQLMVRLRKTKDPDEMESWGSQYLTGAGFLVNILISHPAFSIFSAHAPRLPAITAFHTLSSIH